MTPDMSAIVSVDMPGSIGTTLAQAADARSGGNSGFVHWGALLTQQE